MKESCLGFTPIPKRVRIDLAKIMDMSFLAL